jgi:hypothetical protein
MACPSAPPTAHQHRPSRRALAPITFDGVGIGDVGIPQRRRDAATSPPRSEPYSLA